MTHSLKYLLITLTLCSAPSISSALPAGVPSLACSSASTHKPGVRCYVKLAHKGVRARAGGRYETSEYIVQPQYGYYILENVIPVETSRAGNGNTLVHSILSKGGAVDIASGYKAHIKVMESMTASLEGKVQGMSGPSYYEAKAKLNYLKSKQEEYTRYGRTALSAGNDAPKVYFKWGAGSVKCGWANLDTCGSWIWMDLYEVRIYVGNPSDEYYRTYSPVFEDLKAYVESH